MYVLDSNIISYALKGNAAIRQKMEKTTADGNSLVMPYVVYYEVKRWLLELGANTKRRIFDGFLDGDFSLEPLEKNVWDKASEIYVEMRKKGKPIDDDADILIAAFCLIHGYTLVTNNERHFEHIDGLKYINWAVS
jgi:predicted nucleic acid-binding protein